MNDLTIAASFMAITETCSLRDWDAVVGKVLRGLWQENAEIYGANTSTPVYLECTELVEWATWQFAKKLASLDPLTPSEYLNLEGSRIVRFLHTSGWHGACFVLSCEPNLLMRIAGAGATLVDPQSAVAVRVTSPNLEEDKVAWHIVMNIFSGTPSHAG